MGHLRKQCFKIVLMLELREILSYLAVTDSKGGRDAARSQVGKQHFLKPGKGCVPAYKTGSGPWSSGNLAVFHFRCHFSAFFPHSMIAQSCRSLL